MLCTDDNIINSTWL